MLTNSRLKYSHTPALPAPLLQTLESLPKVSSELLFTGSLLYFNTHLEVFLQCLRCFFGVKGDEGSNNSSVPSLSDRYQLSNKRPVLSLMLEATGERPLRNKETSKGNSG
ncbi:unnamed protein product [Moneuplotes crassus]|uniref:Uncharacterized protein n=1 Tax=Euplotes crassus TaxID=5936 RepID=A0AAD1X789_EUPCR|nr:unnamed protein product [Moneuplotes crassus]